MKQFLQETDPSTGAVTLYRVERVAVLYEPGCAEMLIECLTDDDEPAIDHPTTQPAKAFIPAAATACSDAPADCTEADFNKVKLRLLNGERVGDVAKEFRLNINKLRGHWGLYVKEHKLTGECKTCNKRFAPTADSPDHCANCGV